MAQIFAETRFADDHAAALHLLSRDDTHEAVAKRIVADNSNHNRCVRIVKRTVRPFHKFGEVE